jgi:hypothetical protein
MNAIKAKVRNGRIETEFPLNLPDGTELLVLASVADDDAEEGWDNTPEGIAAWLKWYDSLEPLLFTIEERDAWRKDQEARKEWELAHADEREEKLRRLWE